jgi:hypothetical protein
VITRGPSSGTLTKLWKEPLFGIAAHPALTTPMRGRAAKSCEESERYIENKTARMAPLLSSSVTSSE